MSATDRATLAVTCGCGARLEAAAQYHSDLKPTRDMWERMHKEHPAPGAAPTTDTEDEQQ